MGEVRGVLGQVVYQRDGKGTKVVRLAELLHPFAQPDFCPAGGDSAAALPVA